MLTLPNAPADRVLDRISQTWSPWRAPHMWLLGMTGAGKTTLVRLILGWCCAAERVLVLDPKPADDPSWSCGDWPPAPIAMLRPRFGQQRDGGGPAGTWYRLTASHDPAETARRFTAALRIVRAEGHTVLVIDDAHEICFALGMRADVDGVLALGRSAGISCIVASGDTGYVPRGHAAFRLAGHITGIDAAQAACKLIGQRGRDWEDTLLALDPYQWAYFDDRPGFPGPCTFTTGAETVSL